MTSRATRIIFSFLLFGLLLGLNGCSSIQVSQDYDVNANFSSIQSVQWLDEADQTEPKAAAFAVKNPLVAQRITRSIEVEMAKKNMVFVEQNPTGYVTYHVETLTKARPNPVSATFGFGTYGHFGGIGFQTRPENDYYDQGKLVIDLLNQQKKLIWRGISTRYVEEHTAPDELTETIQEVVQKLLDQYPPKTSQP